MNDLQHITTTMRNNGLSINQSTNQICLDVLWSGFLFSLLHKITKYIKPNATLVKLTVKLRRFT